MNQLNSSYLPGYNDCKIAMRNKNLISTVCFSIKYQPLNDNNSEEFHASFVLELCKPLPAAVEIVHKIYEVVNKTGKMVNI